MWRDQLPSRPMLACGVVIIAVFGCLFGYWQYSTYYDGKKASWIDLGAPESFLNELHLYDAELQDQGVDIYVRDDGKQIFISPYDDPASWTEVEEGPSMHNYYSVEDCAAEIPLMASQAPSYPDQEIVGCRRYVWNWEIIPDETYALLTEDGSIFTWRYSPLLGMFFRYSFEGIGIGFLVLIILMFVYRYQERGSNSLM